MDYGQKVRIIEGEYKGIVGTIEGYMAFTNIYIVNMPNGNQMSFKPFELEEYQDRIYAEDFNMSESNPNGEFVRVSEINKLIEYGAISIDRAKLEEYKFDTRVTYNKDKYTREEAMKLWYGWQ